MTKRPTNIGESVRARLLSKVPGDGRDAAGRSGGTGEREPQMISIDGLGEQELVELNHRVVARLRLLRQNRSLRQMLHFEAGERVCFDGRDGQVVTGVIERFNKKTVTVVSDSPHGLWRVHPGFLRKLHEAGTPTLKLLKG